MKTELGAFVREMRRSQDLTLQELAEKAVLPWTTVQAIEIGDSVRPKPETLRALAGALGIAYDVLVLKAYTPKPAPA